jgi:hypothetical protein
MIVGSEVVDLERMSSQIVVCFRVLDLVLTKNDPSFFRFHNGMYIFIHNYAFLHTQHNLI